MDFDAIIIGCGFAGAIVARKLAEENNLKVLILEKRNHIAGNMYEDYETNGVRVHRYGPHIFHTNSEDVYKYLKRFSDWFEYEHKVLGKIDECFVPIPFNFRSLDTLFDIKESSQIKQKLKEFFHGKEKISVMDLLNHNDNQLKNYGKYVYNKVFVNYTSKQWGIHPDDINKDVINRVPVVLSYDDRYFRDHLQFMPKEGYTALFQKLLGHKNIKLELNVNASSKLKFDNENNLILYENSHIYAPVVFTGAIDEFFNYEFGCLPYRSLEMVFENKDIDNFQTASVVNYPNEESFTRITEFKYLTKQVAPNKTTIMKEYPLEYNIKAEKGNIPYYPIENEENNALYQFYYEKTVQYKNLFLCGRLAEYKYYNMDLVIKRAFEIVEIIRKKYAL